MPPLSLWRCGCLVADTPSSLLPRGCSKNEGVSLTAMEWATRRGHTQLALQFARAQRAQEASAAAAAAAAEEEGFRGGEEESPAASPQKRRRSSKAAGGGGRD